MKTIWPLLGLVLLSAVSAGCQERDIRTHYGSRSGVGATSVNGTSVLSGMFETAGHSVRSWRALSPSLEKADVVVWFPNSHGPPTVDAVAWFDQWLRYSYDENSYEPTEKVLVIVGRCYDAEVLYWRECQTLAPATQKAEYRKRLREAPRNSLTGFNNSAGDCEGWFKVDPPGKQEDVKKLTGPWARGIDASKTSIAHSKTLTPDSWMKTLLADGAGHPLVSQGALGKQDEWRDSVSRIIVVENASFLLNASLVNQENRKLAGKLIDAVGDPEKKVVFLESSYQPTISESDPKSGAPTGLELFRVWPIGAVLAQAAALGLVFAMTRFPIFGVPRRLDRPSLTDFGRHVTALGGLLAATRDRAYAKGLLQKYFHEIKQE